jgi:hypothetical protein
MDSPFRVRLDEAIRHHALMTDAGDDPASRLAHARRLRESVGAGRRAEMDDLITVLEADVERVR